MATIHPFRGIHPAPGLAEKIAALPYDVYNRAEAREAAKKEPLSFLNIDRAETQFEEEHDMYAPEVYQKAHDMLWDMVKDGSFVQDEKECYYLYELVMNDRAQTGIVACASIDDYINGVIKKHENTRADKEEDRIRHVDACDAQTGPIFLAYRRNERLQQAVDQAKSQPAIFDFTTEDGVTHRGWRILAAEEVQAVEEAFENIDKIYIADGHHRCASAVKVGLKRRQEHPDYNGTEEFNYFLSVLFPDEELILSDDPVEGLDVSILQREILSPVLGIDDPKTDARIDFVGGIRGLEELERRVHQDCAVAFAMYPTSIQELFGVADADKLMPPKSTWFEPKLRSGLFIHAIN